MTLSTLLPPLCLSIRREGGSSAAGGIAPLETNDATSIARVMGSYWRAGNDGGIRRDIAKPSQGPAPWREAEPVIRSPTLLLSACANIATVDDGSGLLFAFRVELDATEFRCGLFHFRAPARILRWSSDTVTRESSPLTAFSDRPSFLIGSSNVSNGSWPFSKRFRPEVGNERRGDLNCFFFANFGYALIAAISGWIPIMFIEVRLWARKWRAISVAALGRRFIRKASPPSASSACRRDVRPSRDAGAWPAGSCRGAVMLMLPARDPSLLADGATLFDGAALTGVGPVTAKKKKKLADGTNIDVLLSHIAEV